MIWFPPRYDAEGGGVIEQALVAHAASQGHVVWLVRSRPDRSTWSATPVALFVRSNHVGRGSFGTYSGPEAGVVGGVSVYHFDGIRAFKKWWGMYMGDKLCRECWDAYRIDRKYTYHTKSCGKYCKECDKMLAEAADLQRVLDMRARNSERQAALWASIREMKGKIQEDATPADKAAVLDQLLADVEDAFEQEDDDTETITGPESGIETES